MTSLTDSTQAPYTPLIWDAMLPRAEGVIAMHYHNKVPTNNQVQQSSALFRLISAQDQTVFDALQSITTPAPMLIQNPGTNTVHFIMGAAKFLANPIRHPTGHPLQGSFLAIGKDLVEQGDTPRAIILPDDALKTNMVKIPTAPQFSAKLTQKATKLRDGGGTTGAQFDTSQWFKHSDAGTILCPVPPFLAYDAFLDNVAAHIVWERIAFHEDQHPQEAEFFKGVQNFLQGVTLSTSWLMFHIGAKGYFLMSPSSRCHTLGKDLPSPHPTTCNTHHTPQADPYWASWGGWQCSDWIAQSHPGNSTCHPTIDTTGWTNSTRTGN